MSTRSLADDYIVRNDPELGRVLFVLPTIPDDAPYKIREGIARRRIAALTGECPCCGRLDVLSAARKGTAAVADFPHEDRCPAITGPLLKALRRWAR